MAVINQTKDFLAWGLDTGPRVMANEYDGGNWFAVTGTTNIVMFEFQLFYVQAPIDVYARLLASADIENPDKAFPVDREHSYLNGYEERRDLILRKRMPTNEPFCFTIDQIIQGLVYKLQLAKSGGNQVTATVWGHLGTS